MSKIKVDQITTKDGTGELDVQNAVKIKETTEPSAPTGSGVLYVDSTSKALKFKHTDVNSGTAVDMTASSTGLTSLNGIVASTQTFGNDTNVTMSSSGSEHTLTWAGTLIHERGGLEADVSASNGLIKISGGSTSVVTDDSTNWGTAYTHSQAAHAPSTAEANQNAFEKIVVNSTTGTPTNTGEDTITADTATDTLNLHAGDNITLTHDKNNDAIKIVSTDTTYTVGDGGLTQNNFTDTLKTKLDGIAASATANDTDTNLKARGNHTGTQAASTISDFDDQVATTAVLKGAATTMTANLNMGGYLLDNAKLQSYRETVVASTGTSGAVTLDLDSANVFTTTVTGNITSITFDNVVAGMSWSWIITQHASNLKSITWTISGGLNLKWNGAVTPDLSQTVDAQDIYTFFYDGTTVFGMVAGKGFA